MPNRALWSKAWFDARLLLFGCMGLMFVFHAIFVWLAGLIDLSALQVFLKYGIKLDMQAMMPVPLEAITSPGGMITLAYVHPLVMFTITVWALTRGSDVVSGELDRGTMELLAAQPVPRMALLTAPAAITALGCLLIPAACWLGTCLGVWLVEAPADPRSFLPAAVNLAAFALFLSGLTMAFSAVQRFRWRTIAWVGGLYAVQLTIKIVSQMSPPLAWLKYLTFFTPFEPSAFMGLEGVDWVLAAQYSGLLAALGLTGFAAAGAVFVRRDLPAPV